MLSNGFPIACHAPMNALRAFDVFAAFPQRGQFDGKHVQPIEEVGRNRPVRESRPDRDWLRPRRAHPPSCLRASDGSILLLQDAQQLGLVSGGSSLTSSRNSVPPSRVRSGRAAVGRAGEGALTCPDSFIERVGHRQSAFTGGPTAAVGRSNSDGGTLFLDEVSELPPEPRQSCCASCRSRNSSPSEARRH